MIVWTFIQNEIIQSENVLTKKCDFMAILTTM